MFHLGAALLQNLAVSPGLVPRPSLSEPEHRADRDRFPVSPGLVPRPSLSDFTREPVETQQFGVAGASAPAFVERGNCSRRNRCSLGGVAGASAPAFVERLIR